MVYVKTTTKFSSDYSWEIVLNIQKLHN